MHDEEFLAHLVAVMPAADHIATLDWLAHEDTEQQSQEEGKALKAYFFELSGDKTSALKLYQGVVTELSANSDVRNFAQARISKLEKTPNIR